MLDRRDDAESPKAAEPVDAQTRAQFEAVALPHLDAILRFARALVANESEAHDLVQETFVRAFRAFHRFELREYGPKPWLLRILHNVFYTAKGRQGREPTLLNDVDFDHFEGEKNASAMLPPSIHRIDWEAFDEEIKAAISELRPEFRVVLLLWAIEGLSYREIAVVCDCALGTVMSRLYRARHALREQLKAYAQDRGLGRERSD